MSFLPSLSPGNVKQRLPTGFKFDNDLTYDRPTEFLDLGINAEYGATGVPEKIIGLVAVFPSGSGDGNNYVAFDLDTTDNSNYTVNWGDGTTESLTTDTTHHHVYNYTGITGDTSTTKSTPFRGYRQAIFEVSLQGSAKFSSINFNVDGPYVNFSHYTIRRGPNILDLFVDNAFRRMGIGKKLFATLSSYCIRNNGTWITWQCQPKNESALHFYRSIGGRQYAALDFELANNDLVRLSKKV